MQKKRKNANPSACLEYIDTRRRMLTGVDVKSTVAANRRANWIVGLIDWRVWHRSGHGLQVNKPPARHSCTSAIMWIKFTCIHRRMLLYCNCYPSKFLVHLVDGEEPHEKLWRHPTPCPAVRRGSLVGNWNGPLNRGDTATTDNLLLASLTCLVACVSNDGLPVIRILFSARHDEWEQVSFKGPSADAYFYAILEIVIKRERKRRPFINSRISGISEFALDNSLYRFHSSISMPARPPPTLLSGLCLLTPVV